jgi:hypothetical protein
MVEVEATPKARTKAEVHLPGIQVSTQQTEAFVGNTMYDGLLQAFVVSETLRFH